MAVITTTKDLAGIFQPYIGYPDETQQRTSAPRGEIVFANVGDTVITASGAGDTQTLTIICRLPIGFAYGLSQIFISIGAVSNTWNDEITGHLANQDTLRTYNALFGGFTRGITENAKLYNFPTLPKQLISQATPSGSQSERPFMLINCLNETEQQAVGTLNFYARFFVYDINQYHHFAANEAIQTR